MNRRLLLTAAAISLLSAGSLMSLVSTMYPGQFGMWRLTTIIPASFGLFVGLYSLADILPTLFWQQCRTRKRLVKIRESLSRQSSSDQSRDYNVLESLTEGEPDMTKLYRLLKDIRQPLRSYNFDCLQAQTLGDLEVAVIGSLTRVIQLLQTSKDPFAHLQCYIDETQAGDVTSESDAFHRHISYSVEESLAHGVIFLLKAICKCEADPQIFKWPMETKSYSTGQLQASVKEVLCWMTSSSGASRQDGKLEIYLMAVFHLIAICKAEHIPISFYVAQTLQRGQ